MSAVRGATPVGMLRRTISIDLDQRERKEAKASKRFPASISSDTPITRRTYDGDWTEVLEHTARAIDLTRAPLPLLEGHDRSRTNIGIVSGLRVDGGKLRGEVVLGSSARAEELAQDIADGIVRNLSIGYEILEQTRDEKKKRITATKWRPHECSVVATPADTSVGFGRSAERSPIMEHEQTPTTPPPPAPDEATRTAVDLATRAERERAATIHELVGQHQLGDALARDLVNRGVSLADARRAILDRLAARDEQFPISSHIRMGEEPTPITAGQDLSEDFRRAAIDSLLIRSGIPVAKPHAAARDVSSSVCDLARLSLSRSGKPGSSRGGLGGELSRSDLIKRAMTTSDFPAIMSGSLHQSVRQGYESEPSSHRAWVRPVPVVDFRDQERPILGSAPSLQPVAEHAEYPDGSLTDDLAKYQVSKYGVIVSLTWEVLVNDQIGAFLRVQPALGQAARRKEADLVYALFAANAGAGPAMQDGTNLFHANHANLVTAAAFDATLLGAGRALLRKQQAVGGGYLSLVPRFLIVPSERETAAEVILANATRRTTTEKTTPEWISSLELVVEPRLANTAGFLAADASQIDTVELGLLEDNVGGPALEEEQGFRVDAQRWKVRHVCGVKALDWRGLVKLPITP